MRATHPPLTTSNRGGNLTPASLRRSESELSSSPCLYHPFHPYDQRVWSSNDLPSQLAIQLWWLINYRW